MKQVLSRDALAQGDRAGQELGDVSLVHLRKNTTDTSCYTAIKKALEDRYFRSFDVELEERDAAR